MRIIKYFLILLSLLFISGCSTPKISDKYNGVIDKLNELLNNHDLVELEMDQLRNQQVFHYGSYYKDEEKVIIEERTVYGTTYITQTIDKIYLDGHDFTVYKKQNNSSLFSNARYNIKSCITSVDDSSSKNIIFQMNYKKMKSSHLPIFPYVLIDEVLNYDPGFYKSNVAYLDVTDLYKGKSSFGLCFKSGVIIEGYDYSYTFKYTIKNPVKRDSIGNSKDNYTKIDNESYNFIRYDYRSFLDGGRGILVFPARETFFNTINENDIIGTLFIDIAVIGSVKDLYFKDVTFDYRTSKAQYVFAGKPLEFLIRFMERHDAVKIKEVEPSFEIKSGSTYLINTEENLILLGSKSILNIIDINTLSIIKSVEIEGNIVNIVQYEDMYHVMSVTARPNYNYGIDDSNCEGYINAIDNKTFEITNRYFVHTYPYYTAIDKRGDIIVTSGYGQMTAVYLYKVNEEELITIDARARVNEEACVKYNEDEDTFVLFNRLGSVPTPQYYQYKDGEYSNIIINPHEPLELGSVYVFSNNYVLGGNCLVVDTSNFYHPIQYKYSQFLERFKTKLAFKYDDSFYAIGPYLVRTDIGNVDSDHYFINKIDLIEGDIKETFYKIPIDDYYLSFYKDNSVYLYSMTTNTFVVFELPPQIY